MNRSAAVVRSIVAVPFLDLKAQLQTIRAEVQAALADVMEQTAFALGPAVQEFERAFATYCGTDHCVAVNSGTSALHVALAALNIGPGDEVIVPGMSFIATAWPVIYQGARPVFVDIDPQRYTLDPQLLPAAITKHTRAIIPVHLYGRCADMNAILEIAQAHNIPVIEDAAQAHGATYKGRPAGSMGRLGCFSFYPGKNLGAYGEGGAVVTNDGELAERIRALRDHGQFERYVHTLTGYNYRMDGFQGAVLSVKLRHLERWNAARRRVAATYDELLSGSAVQTPPPCQDGLPVHHLYVIRHSQRDALRAHLADRQIGTGLHYPVPIHLQPAMARWGYQPGSLPHCEDLARTCLSLPIYPVISQEQVETVVEAIRSFELRR